MIQAFIKNNKDIFIAFIIVIPAAILFLLIFNHGLTLIHPSPLYCSPRFTC